MQSRDISFSGGTNLLAINNGGFGEIYINTGHHKIYVTITGWANLLTAYCYSLCLNCVSITEIHVNCYMLQSSRSCTFSRGKIITMGSINSGIFVDHSQLQITAAMRTLGPGKEILKNHRYISVNTFGNYSMYYQGQSKHLRLFRKWYIFRGMFHKLTVGEIFSNGIPWYARVQGYCTRAYIWRQKL